MRGAGFGRAAAQVVGRLARLEQPALRRRSGARRPAAASSSRLRNRRARFLLPPVERVALLLRLRRLARELLALLREPRLLVGRVLQLRVVADDRLFLLVVLGVQRRDRAATPARSCPRAPRSPRASRDSASRSAPIRSRSSLISRFVSRMPRASARPPPETRCGPRNTSPSERRDRQRRQRGWPRPRASYDWRNPRVADGLANGAGERAVDADDRRQRDEAFGQRSGRGERRHRTSRSPATLIEAWNAAAAGASAADVTRNPQRPAPASRTSWKPAAACSGRSTTTCWRRSPRQASTARS